MLKAFMVMAFVAVSFMAGGFIAFYFYQDSLIISCAKMNYEANIRAVKAEDSLQTCKEQLGELIHSTGN